MRRLGYRQTGIRQKSLDMAAGKSRYSSSVEKPLADTIPRYAAHHAAQKHSCFSRSDQKPQGLVRQSISKFLGLSIQIRKTPARKQSKQQLPPRYFLAKPSARISDSLDMRR